jgi:hypothetical protein
MIAHKWNSQEHIITLFYSLQKKIALSHPINNSCFYIYSNCLYQ